MNDTRTESCLIKCKCSVAKVTYPISDRGYMLQTDETTWINAAIYRSAIIGRTSNGYNITVPFYCWNCKRAFKVVPIKGKYSANHKCNAKCLASKGPSCECSCGGKNHGNSYS